MLAERESQVQSLQAEHGHSVSSLRQEREQQLNALRQARLARAREIPTSMNIRPSLFMAFPVFWQFCCLILEFFVVKTINFQVVFRGI